MAISICLAEPRDAAIIAEFNRRMAWETEQKHLAPPALLAGVNAVIRDPDKGRYYVAWEDDEVAGQAMVTREWSDWRNGWWWWLQSVYVRAESRRRGVFHALYAHILAAARIEPDALGIRLYVEEHNAAAQATYRKLGMQPMTYVCFDYRLT